MPTRPTHCHRVIIALFALFAALIPPAASALAPSLVETTSSDGAKAGVPGSPPSARFDAGSGTLFIYALAEAEVRCAQDANGFLTLSAEGLERSGDPSSPNFEPALNGIGAAELRCLKMEGGSRLLVGDLSVKGGLTIEARRLTLTGRLHAQTLRLSAAEQLVVEAAAHLSAQVGSNGGGKPRPEAGRHTHVTHHVSRPSRRG